MEKTLASQKIEKLIEKLLSIHNSYDYESMSPMGDDYLVRVKVKYSKKTNIEEINDDDIEKLNLLFWKDERIPFGTKFYGTIYLKVLEKKYFDEDGELDYLTTTNPVFESDSDKPWDIYAEVEYKLKQWLGDSVSFDIDFE